MNEKNEAIVVGKLELLGSTKEKDRIWYVVFVAVKQPYFWWHLLLFSSSYC